ncbi:hypothetical protein HY256_04760, partial [Candidatus Sumerlaeota bacterium]|nr:hypothetical protein [Candidatus Sumerlaeota bacterium]
MLKFRRHLLASLLTVLLFAANRVNGANTLQFFFPIENSTSTTIDDEIAVKPVSWNSSFEPVNWVLLKPGGGSVLYSPLNIYGISDSQVFDAVVAALGEWNSNSLSNFDYDTALLFSTSPLVPSPKPTEARLDGHHLITFQSALLNSATGPVAVTSLFFLEHDISSSVIAAGVPAGEVENGVGAAVDFNGDGKADITLPVRNYKQGEIIEADIIFNKALSYRQWPADEGDVPPADLPSVPGSLDIQALLTHELGHAQGIAHTWLQDSTMFGFLNGANADFPSDPYNMRSIAFDDEMGGGFLYPKFGSSKGEIKGSIYDGQYVQYLGGTVCPSQEALLFIEQAPVFLGIPAPAGLHPDNVYSTGGVKRLIAQVMSGQSLRYPAGPGGVATLEPATTTVPNIDFNDLGEDTNRNCTLDPGEDTNFNGQLDYSTLAIDSIYRFRGLTPRSDYVVYLDKDFKGLGPSVNPVFDFLNQFEDYDPEFFGGVTAPGRPDQEKNDNPQAATNVAAAAGTVTDNINIITNVEPFVPTPTPTASPYPTASRTPSPSPTISPTPTASPT